MQRKEILLGLALMLVVLPGVVTAEETAAPASPAAAEEAAAPAAEAPAEGMLQVLEAAIATAIENRAPQGAAESFPAGTPKLYCYSKIAGAQAGDEIVHQWMKGDEVVADINLKLGGSPWRTNSSKTMPDKAEGKWSVKIMQGNNVLKVLPFEIVGSGAAAEAQPAAETAPATTAAPASEPAAATTQK